MEGHSAGAGTGFPTLLYAASFPLAKTRNLEERSVSDGEHTCACELARQHRGPAPKRRLQQPPGRPQRCARPADDPGRSRVALRRHRRGLSATGARRLRSGVFAALFACAAATPLDNCPAQRERRAPPPLCRGRELLRDRRRRAQRARARGHTPKACLGERDCLSAPGMDNDDVHFHSRVGHPPLSDATEQ